MINWEAARFGLELLVVLWSAATTIYLWVDRGQRASRARLEELERALSDRITRIEATLQEAPTHRDLGEIYERINAVDGVIRELKGEFTAVNRTLERIHQFLLDQKHG